MGVLYVEEQGSTICRQKGCLVIKKDKEVIKEIPISSVDRIILVGKVSLTASTIGLLLSSNVFTSFVTTYGEYRGSLFSRLSKNVFLRVKQYQRYNDIVFRQQFSKIILLAKVKNLYTLLLKHKRNHPDYDIDKELSILKKIIEVLTNMRKISISQLLGVEGFSARIYYRAFGKIVSPGFKFTKRTKYPPKDKINSLLSLGYTLLFNVFVSILYSHGLDPFVGFFHSLEYGRESLAVDMMEEFRFLIDSLVISLINRRVIKEDDFEFDDDKGYFVLKSKARKIFYEKFENRLKVQIKCEINGSYRSVFEHQTNKLISFIEDSTLVYTPFVYK